MNKLPTNIKNIIFDLGGVIFDIDYHKTIDAFKALGFKNFDEIFTQLNQQHFFDDFEKGNISAIDFYKNINSLFGGNLSIDVINKAWNSMLYNIPPPRINLLQELKKSYRLFLLSNNNDIHLAEVIRIIKNQFGNNPLEECFEKCYYSNQIGFRKPEKESYQFVLKENNLNIHETIFFDDSPQHVEGAQKIGLPTIWVKDFDIVSYFARNDSST